MVIRTPISLVVRSVRIARLRVDAGRRGVAGWRRHVHVGGRVVGGVVWGVRGRTVVGWVVGVVGRVVGVDGRGWRRREVV